MFISDAKWIWLNRQEEPDEYASFVEGYSYSGGNVTLRIAAETNYILYINGKRASFGQFPGFPDEKYCDVIDLSEYSVVGKNTLRIAVRYEGADTFTHIKDRAGVIFEVVCDGEILCRSSTDTLGGPDADYQQHISRLITWQLGYSSDMCSGGETQYSPCREAKLPYTFKDRPVKKLAEEAPVFGKRLEIRGREIYDLGRETAGHVFLDVECEDGCEITVAYGEHLTDGCVRQKIDGRDFSLNFRCKKGENRFEQMYLRIAGRYLEILGSAGAHVKVVGIIPVTYPVEENDCSLTGTEREIYDVCVRTLRLCMHEHYEDCPWREQSLYVLDSRNQMLSGYCAFKDSSFARANIVFMAKGIRDDGLLELTFPAVNTPVIPFFTVIYPVVVREYIGKTGDTSVLDEVMPVVSRIMETFEGMVSPEGLIYDLPKPYWNFYEWSEGSSGSTAQDNDPEKCDLIINCAYVYAARSYAELRDLRGEKTEIPVEKVKRAIKATFYDEEKGIYFSSNKTPGVCTQLGNAFARLIGLDGTGLEGAVKGFFGVVPATLSMKSFVYDALLEDGDANRQYILDDIKANYTYMLSNGATSFWETIKGEADFSNAGSLCHGWSAIPVYYYTKLLK